MKQYSVIIGGIAVILVAALWVVGARTAQAPVSRPQCTLEAKLCPDGSAVGRTGPNCEFAACPGVVATTTTSGGAGILPYHSGVQGNVSLGPTCPVERIPPDPSCADKPYAVAVAVYRTGAQSPFVIGNSDVQGMFKFSLPPGSYRLQATNGKPLPRCASVSVEVPASGYVSTTISCDTGIR